MLLVLLVACWLQVWTGVTGYSSGAPAGRCEDMSPDHGVAAQNAASSPYTVKLSNTTFSANQTIRVVIQGPGYMGLLLQARSGSNTNAVGTWGPPPANTQYLSCQGNIQSAITHSTKTIKNNETTYTWIPAASLNSAFITATVVANKSTFWVNLRSETLSRAPGGGSNAAADVQTAATPVLFLALLMSTAF